VKIRWRLATEACGAAAYLRRQSPLSAYNIGLKWLRRRNAYAYHAGI